MPILLLSKAKAAGGGEDPGGGDPPALVELKEKAQTGSAVNSVNVDIEDVTEGNMIVVVFAVSTGGVSLTASSGTLNIDEDVYSTDWDVSLAIWSAPNAAGGNHTITLTPGETEFIRYAVIEFENVAASNHVIDFATGGGLGSSLTVDSVTTDQSNTLLIGACRTDGDETAHAGINVGSGFTLVYPFQAAEPEQKLMTEYAVVNSGTYPSGALFTTNQADGGGWATAIVAYKAA